MPVATPIFGIAFHLRGNTQHAQAKTGEQPKNFKIVYRHFPY
jgi:hypothetical protein